jgi:hypothetical protein
MSHGDQYVLMLVPRKSEGDTISRTVMVWELRSLT